MLVNIPTDFVPDFTDKPRTRTRTRTRTILVNTPPGIILILRSPYTPKMLFTDGKSYLSDVNSYLPMLKVV